MLTTLALLTLTSPVVPAAPPEGITWHGTTFFDALSAAGERKTHVLAYFWADGSAQCARLYSETMANETAAEAMNDMVCFSANTGQSAGYKLVERFHITTLPTLLFISPDGSVNDAVVGFINADGLSAEIERIASGKDTVADFRQRVEQAPVDLDLKYALSVKLADCGDEDGYRELTEAVMAADPKGKELVAARFHFEKAKQAIVDAAQKEDGTYAFQSADLKPVTRLVSKLKHEELAFEGWQWIAAVHVEAENLPESRVATMKAWRLAKDDGRMDYGGQIAAAFWESREDLTTKEKKFALAVAETVVALTDEYIASATAEAVESDAEGCASLEGCSEGEGCGGCGGRKGNLAAYQAKVMDNLACCLFMNGKAKKAVATIERSIELQPDSEDYPVRLASFKKSQ